MPTSDSYYLQTSDQTTLYNQLDQAAEDREWQHQRALQHAAAIHTEVQRQAELFLEAHEELRAREERLRDLQELEKTQRQAAEAAEAIRRVEEQHAAEEVRRVTEEIERKRRAAEAELQAKEAVTEARRKLEEQQTAAREAAAQEAAALEAAAKASAKAAIASRSAAQTQQSQQSQQPRPAQARPPVKSSQDNSGAEAEHRHYLEIWRRLKELRVSLKNQTKSNDALKKLMGDGRRTIRKCVGQLSTSADAAANRSPNVQLRNVIRESLTMTEPSVNIADYLFDAPPNAAGARCPALLIYFLNIFSKCLISQFLGEVAVAPKTATAIGITGATIFSQEDFRWNGKALTDILISKLHRVCPVLFGINGNDRTEAGKRALGWWWSDSEKTSLCTEQQHYERMTGLGAGFAAMTLRSFKRTTSPYPSWHFWRAMARILNVPGDRVTATHLVVLKSMIEGNEARILDFFGQAGLVVLRIALTQFPRQSAVANGVAAQALLLIPDVLKTEKKLYL